MCFIYENSLVITQFPFCLQFFFCKYFQIWLNFVFVVLNYVVVHSLILLTVISTVMRGLHYHNYWFAFSIIFPTMPEYLALDGCSYFCLTKCRWGLNPNTLIRSQVNAKSYFHQLICLYLFKMQP